ncbi:MAG TPA: DUF6600 domain-containing protein [Candidatus Acidoferrales bacterium]|nr:DUF6600 domain-containing protein [Candidatus Acidoferrales bacterium]
MSRAIGALSLALVCSLAIALPARADDDSTAGSSVGRVSVLHGNVTMQRGDSGDTVAAVVNAPVTVGDYLSTVGAGSRAEVQLDAADYLRVDSDSQLRFTQLDPSQETVQLAAGTVELRMFKADVDPQVDTPSITIRPDVAGEYRVSVASDGITTFTVRSGSADLVSPNGSQQIGAGLTVVISGTSSAPVIRPVAMVAYDGFDTWNTQRDQYVEDASSDQYVNADIVGADDLGPYGQWVYQPSYGEVWVPYTWAVGPGWAPYHYGRWVWEPYYGWTWVGYEPWGWAPYHYGRWYYAAGYGWAWYPGPVYVQPVYRPALVAFFGFGSGGSSFSFAFGNVGWVPLAPYEPFHPWWGPGYYYNRTVINVTTINVTRIYRNTTIEGGVAVVSHDNFTGGGAYRYLQVSSTDLHSVALVRGTVPVVPTRQNLSFTKVDADHPVVATPLSSRFDKFAAPAKLPPTFDTQRTAIQTATMHAPGGSEPGPNGSSPWNRFDAARGPATQPMEKPMDTGTTGSGPHPSTNDPWSKFNPKNNVYTANQGGPKNQNTSSHHGGKQKPSGGSKNPHR